MTRLRVLCFAAVWLFAQGALAQQPRVVVLEFDGPVAKRVRASVVKVLMKQDVELVASDDALDKAGSLGADLGSAAGRAAVARELEIAAFVTGEVTKKGRRFVATLTVYQGDGGDSVGEASISGTRAGLAGDVRKGVWKEHVVRAVIYMASLPLEANVQFMTVMATKMPLVGRG
jgi:hypothetical protein